MNCQNIIGGGGCGYLSDLSTSIEVPAFVEPLAFAGAMAMICKNVRGGINMKFC